MCVNLRVTWQLTLFFSKPRLARDLSGPRITEKLHTVGECTIWSHRESTVSVHQRCVLFPAVGPRSLTGCRRGWAEGGNSSPACCLWPRYNCCSIWDPEPTRVNLSPIGASGTACWQWNGSASRLHLRPGSCRPRFSTASPGLCTPREVDRGESCPMVPHSVFHMFMLAKWQTQFYLSVLPLNTAVWVMGKMRWKRCYYQSLCDWVMSVCLCKAVEILLSSSICVASFWVNVFLRDSY